MFPAAVAELMQLSQFVPESPALEAETFQWHDFAVLNHKRNRRTRSTKLRSAAHELWQIWCVCPLFLMSGPGSLRQYFHYKCPENVNFP